MADVSYDKKATIRKATGTASGKGEGANVKAHVSTIELAASASGTTVKFGEIPSVARLLGIGRVYNDDLATSGSPTLDIGIGSVDSNITSDPDAINDGIDLSSATTTREVVKDAADVGKQAWELVSGQSADPKGLLAIYGTVKDAATTASGTVSLEFFYTLD